MDTDWITDLYYTAMGIYKIPELMGIRFRDEGMFMRNVLTREEAFYVKHPAEEEIYGRLDGSRLLVVRGPKGDGLSVAATAALVRKILLDRAVVVDAVEARDCLRDVARLRRVVNEVRKVSREPVFYLDLSKPAQYPQHPWKDVPYMPLPLDELVGTLKEVGVVARVEEVATVAVLSNDLYEVLKGELKDHATVEVDTDVRFLGKLVETYGGCGDGVAAEVAEAVMRYDCGRAVLAVLAADWLSRRGCGRASVDEAVKAAEEKAKELYVDYIWRTVLNRDRPYANLHAPLILLRYFEGPVPVEAAEEFLIGLGYEWYKVENSAAVRWLAARQCSLVEGAVKKAVETALAKRIDDQPYAALRSAAEDYYKYFKDRGYLK